MSEIAEGCPKVEEIREFLLKLQAKASDPDITLLGQGSFGKVFRYKDWVIKILDLTDASTKGTFERESQILDKLADIKELEGYIAPFCWAADATQKGYIVIKYVKTITLEDLLHRHLSITFQYGYSLIRNLIEGLRLLHAAGYLHRDLKPANILIRAGRGHPEELKTVPIFIDFGLACPFPCNEWWRVGTPGYFPNNWASSSELLRKAGPSGERYTFRNKAYIRKRERTAKNVIEGHLPAPIKYVNNITFTRNARGPGPNWKLLKTRPNALQPIYSQRTDTYSMHKVLKEIFDRIDWTDRDDEKEIVREYLEKLRGQKVAALVSQVSLGESSEIKERRLKALANINRRRDARLENLHRIEAEERDAVKALINMTNYREANKSRKGKRGRTAPRDKA